MQFSSFVAALNILSFNKIVWKSLPNFMWLCRLKFFGGKGFPFLFVSNFKKTQIQLMKGDSFFRLWGVSPGSSEPA